MNWESIRVLEVIVVSTVEFGGVLGGGSEKVITNVVMGDETQTFKKNQNLQITSHLVGGGT